MLMNLLAIIAAFVSSGFISGSVPGPTPEVAAGTSQSALRELDRASADERSVVVARVTDIDAAPCTQAWPYYARQCLHDGRQPNGKARDVRLITKDRSVAGRAAQAKR